MEVIATNRTHQIINPLAPLAYFTPEQEAIFNVSLYLTIGALGAFIWDIITNTPRDYRLVFQHKISFTTLLYFFSRWVNLTSVAMYTGLLSLPLGLKICQNLLTASCVLWHIASSSSTLLFFLRVRAIFNSNKYIVAVFFVLWLGVVGGSLPLIWSGSAGVVGPTDHCSPLVPEAYFSASPITLLVNDTCVFLAVSWRLLSSSWFPTEDEMKRSTLRSALGHNLPVFTRLLIQDGQFYYLVSVVMNVISVIVTTAPGPNTNFAYVTAINTMVVSMMASKVFQRTKLGEFREDEISTTFVEAQLRGQHISTHATTRPKVCQEKPTKADRSWNEKVRSGIFPALVLGGLASVPIVCVCACVGKNKKHV